MRWLPAALLCLALGANLTGWGLLAPQGPPTDPPQVIGPGQEDEVRTMLAPVFARGVSGREATGFFIEGDQVRVALRPSGVVRVRAGGEGRVEAIFEDVAEDLAIRDLLRAAEFGRLYAPASSEGRRLGLLEPAHRATGLGHGVLVALAMALLLVFSIAFGWGSAESSEPAPTTPKGDRLRRALRRFGLPFAVLAVVGARVWAMVRAPLETDEVTPLSMPAFFTNGHDAFVHPPLGRAFGKSWMVALGWQDSTGAWKLRVAYVGVSCIAAFYLLAVRHQMPRTGRPGLPRERIAAAAALFGPTVVTASVLARPYAIVALLTALVIFVCAGPAASRREHGVAIAAAGLALWTDLMAGPMLAALVVLWLGRASRRRAALAALGLALVSLPLAAGVVDVFAHPDPGWPIHPPVADLPVFGARAAAFLLTGTWLDSTAGSALLALLVAVALVRAWRARPDVVLGVCIALGLAIAVAGLREVRPRNLVPLPFLAALLVPAALTRPNTPTIGDADSNAIAE